MPDSTKKRIKRSRLGCHRCKKLKIKCSEDRPTCTSCLKANASCDYSLKLTWGGRPYKNAERRKASQVHVVPPNSTDKKGASKPGEITFVPSAYGTSASSTKSASLDSQLAGAQLESDSRSFQGHYVTSGVIVSPSLATSMSATSSNRSDSMQSDEAKAEPYEDKNISTLLQMPDMNDVVIPDEHLNHIPSISNGGSPSSLSGLLNLMSQDLTDHVEHIESHVRSEDLPRTWKRDTPEESNALVRSPSSSYLSPPVSMGSDPLLRYHSLLSNPAMEEASHAWQKLYSIPAQLTPLPDILLKVPSYRELLRFWVEVASNDLVPAPSHLYTDNPFKVLVPQMAMRYPGVLTTVLAFAARWRSCLMNDLDDSDTMELVEQLLNRSCNELLKQLQNEKEATSDGALLTALLLSCYEVVNSNDIDKHRTHTIGASQIVLARSASQESQSTSPSSDDSDSSDRSLAMVFQRDESNTAFFLTRWFFYVDVLGALSTTRGQDKYLRGYRNGSHYAPVDTLQMPFGNSHNLDPKGDIDFFMGFDARIIPHLINIALLIREVERLESTAEDEALSLPVWLVTAALETKEKLNETHTAGEARRQAQTE